MRNTFIISFFLSHALLATVDDTSSASSSDREAQVAYDYENPFFTMGIRGWTGRSIYIYPQLIKLQVPLTHGYQLNDWPQGGIKHYKIKIHNPSTGTIRVNILGMQRKKLGRALIASIEAKPQSTTEQVISATLRQGSEIAMYAQRKRERKGRVLGLIPKYHY